MAFLFPLCWISLIIISILFFQGVLIENVWKNTSKYLQVKNTVISLVLGLHGINCICDQDCQKTANQEMLECFIRAKTVAACTRDEMVEVPWLKLVF